MARHKSIQLDSKIPPNLSFRDRVLAVVEAIPAGQTLTYKDVAELAGSPGAARAVGTIMKSNYDPRVPCHRVIHSDGTLGEYNRGGTSEKAALLQQEKSIS